MFKVKEKRNTKGRKKIDITRFICYKNKCVYNSICKYLGDRRSWISLEIGTL